MNINHISIKSQTSFVLISLLNGEKLSHLNFNVATHGFHLREIIYQLGKRYAIPIKRELRTNPNTNKKYKVYWIDEENTHALTDQNEAWILKTVEYWNKNKGVLTNLSATRLSNDSIEASINQT